MSAAAFIGTGALVALLLLGSSIARQIARDGHQEPDPVLPAPEPPAPRGPMASYLDGSGGFATDNPIVAGLLMDAQRMHDEQQQRTAPPPGE